MSGDARWLDRDALAAYICVRPDAVARLQKAGRLPAPSYHLGDRKPRWDRQQVDATLSGGVASTNPTTAIQALADRIAAKARSSRRPQAPR